MSSQFSRVMRGTVCRNIVPRGARTIGVAKGIITHERTIVAGFEDHCEAALSHMENKAWAMGGDAVICVSFSTKYNQVNCEGLVVKWTRDEKKKQ